MTTAAWGGTNRRRPNRDSNRLDSANPHPLTTMSKRVASVASAGFHREDTIFGGYCPSFGPGRESNLGRLPCRSVGRSRPYNPTPNASDPSFDPSARRP